MNSKERHELRYQRRKAAREARRYEKIKDALDFDKVMSYSHMYRSARKCYKGVRWKASVQMYRAHGGINAMRAYKEIKAGKFNIRKGPEFEVVERGKRRRINSIHIKDRVPSKCMCNYSLKPVLHRSLVYDNCASQEGKGTSQQRKRLECHLQRHFRKHGMNGGLVIFDFHGFFESIMHSLVRGILDKNYTDRRIVGFNMKVVRTFRKNVGLVLGSENSQDFAISVPNLLDHSIKEVLGIGGYGRYNDDGYVIHEDWEYLKTVFAEIKRIAESMGFTLNDKKCRMVRFGKPFRFLKTLYRVTDTGKIIKTPHRRSVVMERRKVKHLHKKFLRGEVSIEMVVQSITSWKSSLAHTKCHKVVRSIEKLYNRLFIEPFIRGTERRNTPCITN